MYVIYKLNIYKMYTIQTGGGMRNEYSVSIGQFTIHGLNYKKVAFLTEVLKGANIDYTVLLVVERKKTAR